MNYQGPYHHWNNVALPQQQQPSQYTNPQHPHLPPTVHHSLPIPFERREQKITFNGIDYVSIPQSTNVSGPPISNGYYSYDLGAYFYPSPPLPYSGTPVPRSFSSLGYQPSTPHSYLNEMQVPVLNHPIAITS
eukprot:TRINITY_DN8582_c0_g1_i1.p1 TRINITY_DN8582_c0_g1~~TRINITY_DN8582_c0_g1_i1.p1  ORF type:complete len:133 (-),score=10.49 TRINITY_DN8582_c0_g1_i1:292-690(-)